MLAELEGIAVHYQCVGKGKPMLMLHGGYVDHRQMMEEMEPAFAGRQDWLRIYPDLPGHGQTRAPGWMKNHDHILDVVLRLVDAVIPGQRFAVAGMSAGGHIARGLVQKCGERLTGVMFNATPFVVDYAKRKVPEPTTIREEEGFPAQAGDGIDMLRHMQPVRDQAIADWYRRNFTPARKMLDEAFASSSWEVDNYAFSFDVKNLAKPFAAPALILCGRQDTIVGYRDAWPVIEHYPHATFAVLDWGGHIVAPARPDLFRALVVDWLDRIEATADSD